jgi:hypothetical protein
MTKKIFLTAYDYGMGAIWLVFSAHDANQIIDKYPLFKIISPRPIWMNDSEYVNILDNWFFDIDDEPSGWLLEFNG